MARILDLVPPLYRQESNDLTSFLAKLEPELDSLEKKISGITELIDVDKCPEEYLPYLAALTNAPLLGDDPRLWRRQIRNWPWLLKYKGTERSLALFLNSVGAESYTLHTWFRDAEGNYVEEKPEGEPFYDEKTGLWRNARTHYFSVDMVVEGKLIEYQVWSPEEIKKRILSWLETAKPFHAELLKLAINMPDKSVDAGPLYLGIATVTASSQRIHPEIPSLEPSVMIVGTASLLSGEKILGLPFPRIEPTNAGAGVAVVLASFIRVGRLNEPRPFMEVWPQHVKAGIASFVGGKMKINPSVSGGGGTMKTGMATYTASFITLTQEAI
jgi:phage tail-like protein